MIDPTKRSLMAFLQRAEHALEGAPQDIKEFLADLANAVDKHDQQLNELAELVPQTAPVVEVAEDVAADAEKKETKPLESLFTSGKEEKATVYEVGNTEQAIPFEQRVRGDEPSAA